MAEILLHKMPQFVSRQFKKRGFGGVPSKGGKMKANKLPPAEYLHECFEYKQDGVLIGKFRPRSHFNSDNRQRISNSKKFGKPIGFPMSEGYLGVELLWDGKRFKVGLNRIIWTMFKGIIPDGVLC